MIIISVNRPGSGSTTHRLEAPSIRIGREADNDIVLESFTCSRYHAEIRQRAGAYRIFDCGSTNGVYLDGQKVHEAALENGQTLTIGEYELSLSIPPAVSAETVLLRTSDLLPTPQPPTPPKAPEVLYLHWPAKGREQSFKIAAGVEYMLGRSPGCDVVIDDSRCSGRHALIFSRDSGFFVRDLGSANGVYLNGERVEEAAVRSGDRIRLGEVEISVSDQPRDAADEEILLARTQLGVRVLPDLLAGPPAAAGPSAAAAPAAAGPPSSRQPIAGPLFWGAGLVAVVAVAALAVIALRLLGPTPPTRAGGAGDAAAVGAEEAVLVQARPVVKKELAFAVTGAGSVQPHRRVTVSAEVAGRVVEIPVAEGSAAQAGELLVRLDDREVRLAIEEARSSISRDQVDLARQELERRQRLFDDGALTRSALDQAKTHYLSLDSAYRTAQARIAQLRERADKARVTAPIAGTVARTLLSPGELAGPGTPLVVLEDASEVLVVVEVSDRDVVKVKPLQVVEATTDAFPDVIFQGVVDKVDATANPISKGFEVEARIANPDGRLRSGMITSIRVLHAKRSSLVVPAEALLSESGDRARAFVVEEGVARARNLELGGRIDREVEVLRGLQAGDQVIVFGQEQVEDGQAVRTYEPR